MSSELHDCCKQLKLKNIVEIYEEVSYKAKEQYLTELFRKEIESRHNARVKRLLRKAGFSSTKTLDGYVFDPITWPRSGSKKEVLNLAFLEKHKSGTLPRFLQELRKCELLILDELGFVPFHRDGSELLFNVIADCYERRSVTVTSNLEFSQWNQIFGDNRLAAALIDRLVHHSHILAFTGESIRLRQAMERSENVMITTPGQTATNSDSG